MLSTLLIFYGTDYTFHGVEAFTLRTLIFIFVMLDVTIHVSSYMIIGFIYLQILVLEFDSFFEFGCQSIAYSDFQHFPSAGNVLSHSHNFNYSLIRLKVLIYFLMICITDVYMW